MLASTVFGVRFPGPLGLAAGFDKDGTGLKAWGALGFGFAEVGTVTAHPQPGNPPPRLFRLPDDRALLNRMGFNNHGAGELALRLAHHLPDVPIGVNIGKTKTTPPRMPPPITVPAPGCSARWRTSSSSTSVRPTPPGCAICRPSSRCARFSTAVLAETSTPVLVKIAPDLSDADIDEIADLAVELGLAGIVATNTTISRDGLAPRRRDWARRYLRAAARARSAEVLRRLYGRVGDRLVLISVGGIETADDAWERITAGASLLQGYTGFVYGGGLWAKQIHDGIAGGCATAGSPSLPTRSVRPRAADPPRCS